MGENPMRIVVLDGCAANPGDLSWDALRALGETVIYDRTPTEEIVPRALGADAVLTNKCPMTAETIAALKGLKYIGVLATGYNIAMRYTSLDDFAEWLTIETFGVIADKIDKHYYDITAPDSFSQFINLDGRAIFKNATKYYLVNFLNATTYQLEGGSVLCIETEEFFPMLYGFTVDSRNVYLKARLVG